MARIRTIKPTFWSDAKVCRLSIEAQLLLLGLLTFADDRGLLWDDPDQIQMDVFPSRPHLRIPAFVEELLLSGIVRSLDTTIGRHVLLVVNFERHQRIDHPTKSVIEHLLVNPLEPSRVLDPEGKGREGKGEERKGKERAEPSVVPLARPKASPVKRRADLIPPDWAPSATSLSWANDNHPKIDSALETEKFINHANANGRSLRDFDAAWRNWIIKAEDFNPKPIPASRPTRSQNQINADHAARMLGLNPADTDPFGTAPDEPWSRR